MKAKDILGRRGEDLATAYLVEHGYAIIDRNWRCSQGEIDVVAEHLGVTVFVEVKTRSGLRFGHPFEAITLAKMRRLHRLSWAWCEAAAAAAQVASSDALTPARLPACNATYPSAGGLVRASPRLGEWPAAPTRRQIRIDAIGVVAQPGQPVSVEHLVGIF